MMSRIEYFKRRQKTGKWCTLELFSVALCIILLTGCAEHDRALVLDLQESASESETAQNMGAARDNEQKQSGDNVFEDERAETAALGQTIGSIQDAEVTMLYIHVCGAVVSPGVVEVQGDSRVNDALQAAGGFREDAATDYVNLAARVEDGQQLYFPTKEEAEELAKEIAVLQQEEQAAQSGKVNLNTAGPELLCTLPGIGEARAQDIISYRETNGGFQSIEDIMQVPGIKESVYEKLWDKITVN